MFDRIVDRGMARVKDLQGDPGFWIWRFRALQGFGEFAAGKRSIAGCRGSAGVFAVGGITLFASHLIDSEKLDLWLSLISGLLVAFMGLNLLLERSKTRLVVRTLVLKKLKTKNFNNNWFLRTKVLTTNCE